MELTPDWCSVFLEGRGDVDKSMSWVMRFTLGTQWSVVTPPSITLC